MRIKEGDNSYHGAASSYELGEHQAPLTDIDHYLQQTKTNRHHNNKPARDTNHRANNRSKKAVYQQ